MWPNMGNDVQVGREYVGGDVSCLDGFTHKSRKDNDPSISFRGGCDTVDRVPGAYIRFSNVGCTVELIPMIDSSTFWRMTL